MQVLVVGPTGTVFSIFISQSLSPLFLFSSEIFHPPISHSISFLTRASEALGLSGGGCQGSPSCDGAGRRAPILIIGYGGGRSLIVDGAFLSLSLPVAVATMRSLSTLREATRVRLRPPQHDNSPFSLLSSFEERVSMFGYENLIWLRVLSMRRRIFSSWLWG